jgi:hypothetical protein
MFPTAHPDIMGQLANERAAGLRAAADRYRLGRPFLARWRPARPPRKRRSWLVAWPACWPPGPG